MNENGRHRLLILVCLACATALPGRADPFSPWYTNSPLVVARAQVSIFDVHASTIDPNRFFTTHWGFGSLAGFGISEFTLQRPGGRWIVGLDDPNSIDENRLWTKLFPAGSADFAKSLDILSEDTGTVRIVTSAEDNGTGLNGSVQLFSITRNPSNIVSVARWKDLTAERTDGGDGYYPEGIAVNRDKRWIAVVTDDGTTNPPVPPRMQSVRIYRYDSTNYAENGTVTNLPLVPSGNGRQAFSLPDDTFLVNAGTLTESQGIWKVDPASGTVTQLLDRAALEDHPLASLDPGRNVVQDMLVYRGHLYVLVYLGAVLAFEWDNSTQTVVDDELDGIWNLQNVTQTKLGIGVAPGGLDVTIRGDLLVASLSPSGAAPVVLAFNAVPVPKGAIVTLW